MRLPRDKALEACAGSPDADPTDLGDYAPLLADIRPEAYEQSWYVDPSYFQYQQCECLMVSGVINLSHTVTSYVIVNYVGEE